MLCGGHQAPVNRSCQRQDCVSTQDGSFPQPRHAPYHLAYNQDCLPLSVFYQGHSLAVPESFGFFELY